MRLDRGLKVLGKVSVVETRKKSLDDRIKIKGYRHFGTAYRPFEWWDHFRLTDSVHIIVPTCIVSRVTTLITPFPSCPRSLSYTFFYYGLSRGKGSLVTSKN